MAYRDFLNETPYESPVLGDLPRSLQALQFTQQQKLLRQRQVADAANDLKTFQATSTIPKYDRGITHVAGQATQMRLNELHQGQMTPSQQTKAFLDEAPKLNSLAIANKDELGRLNKQILENTDPYYRKESDLKKAADVIADTGEPFGYDLLNKDADKISHLRQSLNDDENVMENYAADKAAADWVQKHKTKSFENINKGQSGAKYGSTVSGLFFDKNGKPGITDEHITDFLNYHPKQKPYYTHLAMNDILADIKKARAADPNFMKDMDDGEALSAIIQNPSLDPVNKQPVNERAREKAKETIKSLESITRKVDTDLSDVNPASEAGILSKDVSSNEVFNGNTDYSAVGRTISRTKPATSPYFKFSSRSPIRLDTQTGKISSDNMPREFILNTVEVVPVNASGIPIGIKAGTVEEMEKQINEMPSSAFGKGGITGTKMAFRGQSVDKSVIDEAYKKKEELESQHAQNPDDASIGQKLSFLNEQLDKYNYGESVNYKFLEDLTGRKALHDELMPVDPGDVNSSFVKDQTGADVYSQKFQSPAMQRIKVAVDRRVAEANATPQKEAPVTGPPRAKKTVPKITPTPDEFNSVWKTLKSGEKTVGPDGVEYTKK